MAALFTKLIDKEQRAEAKIDSILSSQQQLDAISFGNRLAHTPPDVISDKIKHSKCPSTPLAAAWCGAKSTLGSWCHAVAQAAKKSKSLKASLATAHSTRKILQYLPDQQPNKITAAAAHMMSPNKEPDKVAPSVASAPPHKSLQKASRKGKKKKITRKKRKKRTSKKNK